MLGVVKLGVKAVSSLFKGAGTLAKATPAVASTAVTTYAGWNFFVNDKSVTETASEVLLPKETSETVGKTLSNVNKTVENISDIVAKGSAAVNDMLTPGSPSGANPTTNNQEQEGGIMNSLGNLFGGGNSIFDGVGNMVNSLISGNMLKPLGLIAGLWMMFGRSSWMAKIGGALMMLMTMGMGSNSQTQQQAASNGRSLARDESQSQDRTQSSQQTVEEGVQSRNTGMRM